MVATLVVAAIGVVLPLPTFRTEQAMATETRRPLAEGATVQPAPDEPPVTEEGPVAPDAGPADSTTTTAAPPTTTATTGATTTTTTAPAPAPDARVVVAEDTRDFDLIGVTLPGAPRTPVLVRTADAAGVWTAWSALEFEDLPAAGPAPVADVPPEPDEAKPGAHSSPFWVGDATRYELDLAAADAEVAEVHLVYETTRRVVVDTQEAAGADPGAPAIYGRDHWGARAPNATPTIASQLNGSVLHHTAGANSYSPGDVPGILRGIQAYHMDANGWDDIAYNFLVDYFGPHLGGARRRRRPTPWSGRTPGGSTPARSASRCSATSTRRG